MTGIGERLADLDAMGLDLQVIMCPPPQCYYTVPLDIAAPASRMVNEGLSEYAAQTPDRYAVLGTVPLQDGDEAAKELEHAMTRLGHKGVQILTNIDGKELSDPVAAPFWAKAEELGALVVIHPNGFTEGQRLARFYFNNVVGNPFETTLALHYLIFDGVLERHPNLKIVAVHGGGYLAAYSGRIVVAGKYTRARGEAILSAGLADLVAFGRPFIANPDLPRRFAEGLPLSAFEGATLFGGDAHGYTSYPAWPAAA